MHRIVNAMSERKPEIIVNRALIRNSQSELLAVRRSGVDSHAHGALEFPGGKVDPGETMTEGLLRELHEETGLEIIPDTVFRYMHSEILTEENSKKYPGHRYTVLFRSASLAKPQQQAHISEEHSEALWVPPIELLQELTLTIECRDALECYIRKLRSY